MLAKGRGALEKAARTRKKGKEDILFQGEDLLQVDGLPRPKLKARRPLKDRKQNGRKKEREASQLFRRETRRYCRYRMTLKRVRESNAMKEDWKRTSKVAKSEGILLGFDLAKKKKSKEYVRGCKKNSMVEGE